MTSPDVHLVLREDSADARRLRGLLDDLETLLLQHADHGGLDGAAPGDGRWVALDLASQKGPSRLRSLHLECDKGDQKRSFTIRTGAVGELIEFTDLATVPAGGAPRGGGDAPASLASKSAAAKLAPPPEVAKILEAGVKAAESLITKVLGPKLHLGPGYMDHFNATAAAIADAVTKAGIGAWCQAACAYESRTFRHVFRVAGFAAAFTQSLGFPQRDRVRLIVAGLLHDIGKSEIPARIRDKAGRLDQGEMALMRTHPQRGHQILVDAPDMDPQILDIVLHHHEFLDGSGYPERLQGAQIRDVVRLMTITSTFAALMEAGANQEAVSGSAALKRMQEMDTKLDPALVHAFRPVALAATG